MHMKIKNKFYFMVFIVAITLNSSAIGGRVLDGKKVVNDEDIEWLREEGFTSNSTFIRQARALDPEDLNEIDTLDLEGALLSTSGLQKVSDELLPYLPNLKFLNIHSGELRAPEDLELISDIIERFKNLDYVNIVGNKIATQTLSFVKEREGQKKLNDKFRTKVIFSKKSMLDNQFSISDRENYEDWYNLHTKYYKLFP